MNPERRTRKPAVANSMLEQESAEGRAFRIETDLPESGRLAANVLIVQADRLGSGNMRSIALEVFPDAHVAVVRTGAEAMSAIQGKRHKLAVFGLSVADLVWVDDLPRILTLLRHTPALVISGRHAPRTFRLLNQIRTVSIFDPVTEGPLELRNALAAIVEGRRYLSPSVQKILLDEREVKPELLLSATEEKILSVIGDGSDDAEASQRLSLTPVTLATHRRNIMKKLDLHHRGQLVRFALKHGYVTRSLDGSLVPGLVAILASMENRDGRRAKDGRCG